jgi:hypothetical protein
LTTKKSDFSDSLLVLCNGSSVKSLVDWGFDNLPENLDTVGTSLAYRYFEEIDWWPTYYALGDPKVVEHHRESFQRLIADPNIPIKKYYLCTKLPHLGIDVEFYDPYDRVVETMWQVTGQIAFKVGFRGNYKNLYLIGCDNSYYWDHSLVKPLSSNLDKDNRAIVLEDVIVNPNYGMPNYLRKGDITSWLFNHPDKSTSTTSGNDVWEELLASATLKKMNVVDFSKGNLPNLIRSQNFVEFFTSDKCELY